MVNVSEPALGQWCEKDGEKHGREVWRHKNLVKAAEVLWVQGKKHRLERWWRPEGFKHLQTNWAHGLKHGLEIRWTQKGGFGQATCFLSNELVWSTSSVVEAQTRTCIEPEKAVAKAPEPDTETPAKAGEGEKPEGDTTDEPSDDKKEQPEEKQPAAEGTP